MNRSISRKVIPMAAAAVRYGVPYSLQCAPKLEKGCPQISLFFPSEGITLCQTQKNNNQTNKKWVYDFFIHYLKKCWRTKIFKNRIYNLIMIHLTNSVAWKTTAYISKRCVSFVNTSQEVYGQHCSPGQKLPSFKQSCEKCHYTSNSIQKILLVVVNVDKRL